jgi:hypothetical protein
MSGHWKFVAPDVTVPMHVTGSTPGNTWRYIRRLTSELRRKGLAI